MAETIDRLVLFCKEMEETHAKRCKAYDDASGYTRTKNKDIRTARAIKEEIYSGYYKQLAELVQGWIPVSERLPELITHKTSWGMVKKSELVYITYQQNGKPQYCPIPCYYHSNGNWYTDRKSVEEWANLDEYDDLMDDALCCEVIAWMPLPKPYKAESEG